MKTSNPNPIAYRKSLEDIINRQKDVLQRVRKCSSKEEWDNLREDIFAVGLGFLSPTTRTLLTYFTKFKLWEIEEAKETLYDYLFFDFQNALKIIFGYAKEEPFKPLKNVVTTLEQPVSIYDKLVEK
ncbi:MAG: hypothetical protein ACP6IU_15000 [Candidatus Asgardarchaeia archaeon]